MHSPKKSVFPAQEPCTFTRRGAVAVAAVALFAAAHGTAVAQQWPSKPIKLIVPFTAGSGTDVIGRTLANALSEALGQSVIVENRTGAAGTLGADAVSKATPDGYTLLLGQTIPNAIAPFTMAQIPYKADAFTPIAHIGTLHNVLVIPATLGVNNIPDFVSLIKQKPGVYSYSTSGPGSTHHISAIQFSAMYGLSMITIPYKGSSQALPDMLSGQIAMRFDTIPPVLGSIQAGKVHALAVSSDTRLPYLPNVPTFKEAGIGDVTSVNWYSLLGPKGMPAPVVARLNALVIKLMAEPQLRQKLEPQGFVAAAPMTPEALGAFLVTEQGRYSKIARELKIDMRE